MDDDAETSVDISTTQGEEETGTETSSDYSASSFDVKKENEKEEKEEYYYDRKWYRKFLTFLYIFIYFGKGFSQMSIALTMTDLQEYLSEYNEISLSSVRFYTMILRGLGLTISSYLIGELCEIAKPTRWYHLNLHHVVCIISFLGNCFAMFLVPVIPNPYLVLPLNFFWGVGESAIMIVNQILCRDVWEDKRMNAAIYQSYLCAFGLGMLIYSYAVGKTVFSYFEHWEPRTKVFVVYYIGGLIQTIPYLLLFFLPPPKSTSVVVDSNNNNREEEDSFCTKLKRVEKLRMFFIIFTAITSVLHIAHLKIFQDLIPSYLYDLGWTKQNGSYAAAVFFFSYTISRFFAIFINYYVKSTILCSVFLFSMILTLFIMWNFQGYNTVLWIGFGTTGFFSSPVFAALTQIPRCYNVEVTHVERSLIMSPLGIGVAMPGIVGSLMVGRPERYFISANLIGGAILITFVVMNVLGYRLMKRYIGKEGS